MGVRPPDSGSSESPDVIEFGIAAVDERLDLDALSYPVDVAELREEFGGVEVPYTASGQTTDMTTVLKRVDAREFDSKRALLNELHPVFEEMRASASSSIIGQLRALVPF
jgi:hypothetical protein